MWGCQEGACGLNLSLQPLCSHVCCCSKLSVALSVFADQIAASVTNILFNLLSLTAWLKYLFSFGSGWRVSNLPKPKKVQSARVIKCAWPIEQMLINVDNNLNYPSAIDKVNLHTLIQIVLLVWINSCLWCLHFSTFNFCLPLILYPVMKVKSHFK